MKRRKRDSEEEEEGTSKLCLRSAEKGSYNGKEARERRREGG